MSERTGKAVDISVLKRILHYTNSYKKLLWGGIILTILLSLISPIRPYLMQYTIDNPIAKNNYQGLWLMVLAMIIALVIEGIIQFYADYAANILGQHVIKDIRHDIYKKIIHFKLSYFDTNAVGTLVTRAVSDTEQIAQVFSDGLLMIAGDILKLIVLIIIMFYTDWRLTLISLSSIPILLIATNIFKNAVRKAFQDVRTQVSRLNTFVQEHITGMAIVQIFNREEKEYKKFLEINAAHRDANIKSIWHYSVFFPVVEILSSLSLALLVWWGTKGVIQHTVTLGNLVAFIMYINMLFRPIRMLADRFNTLQMGVVCSERVLKIIDTEEEYTNEGTYTSTHLKGNIELEKVGFAYKEDQYILKDFSLSIKAGEKVAIVGATGAGKSTIINLINRLYEYQDGDIKIDGISIKEYELKNLREKIAIVLQDVFLFSDSIYNNITLHNTIITKEKVIEAAKKIGAHPFIMQLPGNYDYNVRERGSTLSVGQRQLISFVRAYVHEPQILILDEATSSIDTETELLIQKATTILTQDKTSIIIAHRLSTIQNADRIIVMDKGAIVEQGNHKELLSKNGYYKNLYELQFKEHQLA